jgi:hypothetical protein
MEEQEHFIRVQITIELNLYHGRLAMPLNGNYLIYFKDQFTKQWTDESQLRPGEYIYLVDEHILPPE